MHLARLVLFRYRPGTSFLHRMDPRLKFASYLILAASGAFFDPPVAGAALAGIVLLGLVSHVEAGSAVGQVLPLAPFLALLFISRLPDVVQGAVEVARILYLVGLSVILVAVTKVSDLEGVVAGLLKPLGRSAADLVILMRMTLTMIPLLLRLSTEVGAALAVRGAVTGNPLRYLTSYGRCLVTRSAATVQRYGDSLTARGYEGLPRRSRRSPLAAADWAAFAFVLVGCAAAAAV